MLVNTPTGRETGAARVRASRSVRVIKAAPTIKERGIKRRCPGPTSKRRMWGIISPTKEMIPLMATAAEQTRAVRNIMHIVVLFTFTPMWAA